MYTLHRRDRLPHHPQSTRSGPSGRYHRRKLSVDFLNILPRLCRSATTIQWDIRVTIYLHHPDDFQNVTRTFLSKDKSPAKIFTNIWYFFLQKYDEKCRKVQYLAMLKKNPSKIPGLLRLNQFINERIWVMLCTDRSKAYIILMNIYKFIGLRLHMYKTQTQFNIFLNTNKVKLTFMFIWTLTLWHIKTSIHIQLWRARRIGLVKRSAEIICTHDGQWTTNVDDVVALTHGI